MAVQKNSMLYFNKSNIINSTLFYSIRRRKKSVTILSLIQEGADIDARDSKRYTPLLLASKYGLETVVNLLIDCGARVDSSECPFKRTLLHYASGYGWTEIVQSFLKKLPSMMHRKCSVTLEESTFPTIHAKDLEGRTALHLASLYGHLEVVKCLLEKGAELLTRNECGETALHEASGNGHLEVVKLLVEKGAELDARDKYGDTALNRASGKGHLEVVKYLSEKEPNLITKNENSKTALHRASGKGHLEVVKFLVEKGAKLDARDKNGETALLRASCKGHLEVVKYLLDEGADMEVNSFGTPLLAATDCLFTDVIVLLINSGANVDCCDDNKSTVLHYASRIGWIEMVQYLVKRRPVPPFTLHCDNVVTSDGTCPTIHARDMEGGTALHEASFHGHLEVVKFLAEEGANLNAKNEDGWTALYEASFFGHLEIVKHLVEAGADMDAKCCNGDTPLLVAARLSHKNVVDLLVNSGANLDGCDEAKCTVLYYASQEGWTQLVQYLVRRVSDLDARDNYGETALFCACRGKQLQCVEYLLKAGARWDIQNKDGELPINLNELFYPSVKFFQLFIEAGAYLMPVDYYRIGNNFRLKMCLLQDVKFCCQAVVNKFNARDLPALYELPASASLPRIERMIIASNSKVAQTIEQTVTLEIQRNGHCNVLEVRPIVLSLFSIKSVLEYYDKRKSVLQNQLKRLATSDFMNEYQHLSKSMRLS